MPNDVRWDYGVGIKQAADRDQVVWIEVHSASSSHVDTVLTKLAWLRSWVRSDGTAFAQMSARYVWLATSDASLSPNTPKRRLIAERGLEFRSKIVNLDEVSG